LVGRPEGKRPLERPRRRWEDNFKMDLREIGIDEVNWIRLAQDRVQWRIKSKSTIRLILIHHCQNPIKMTVMNLRVP
jgi:hypothetical protein